MFDARDAQESLLPSMHAFVPYARTMEALVEQIVEARSIAVYQPQIDVALDGEPNKELRRVTDIIALRATGAYFTGRDIATKAIHALDLAFSSADSIFDPACGAGDLLIACTPYLPTDTDLKSTLTLWGQMLVGFDIHPEFVRTTKARLVLAAINRNIPFGNISILDLDDLFPRIKQGNSLDFPETFQGVSYIVINPPYFTVQASKDCTWASGKVSMAAVFMEACVSRIQPGTRITAILPDVLRAGKRYERWRRIISEKAIICSGQSPIAHLPDIR